MPDEKVQPDLSAVLNDRDDRGRRQDEPGGEGPPESEPARAARAVPGRSASKSLANPSDRLFGESLDRFVSCVDAHIIHDFHFVYSIAC